MNAKHLDALFKAAHSITAVKLQPDGPIIAADGHIAAIVEAMPDRQDDPEKFPAQQKFTELWTNLEQQSNLAAYTPEDHCVMVGKNFMRRIGVAHINEQFYRIFTSPSVSWHVSRSDKPLLVRQGNQLIGIVMPIKRDNFPEDKKVTPPSDAEVFASIACVANDYYLQGDDVLIKEIKDLSSELYNARDKVEEAQAECDSLVSELASKRKILDARTKAAKCAS